ncbi:MAG: PQQ-dependent sugar dehydrogenase [Nocardioidaceae bacterium]|nr:PQQ-dependent sugar dehydrogenase [Nocardioidaceae bacterium]
MRRPVLLALVLTLGSLVVLTAPGSDARPAAYPQLRVTAQVRGLTQPWDVKPLPGGRLLVTERATRRLILWRAGGKRVVRFPSASVWSSGETGLMGLAVDPAFTSNRRIYTCQGGFRTGGGHDVRVVAWRLNSTYTAVRRLRTLVAGIPATTGRHGGCRLLIPSYGALLVGTGDAAIGTNAQSLGTLGGKVLRVNRFTGAPWPGNPFVRSANPRARLILTYGHRNVQGLAQRADGSLWSVEHGPDRDDEVNRLVRGGNYGWNPVPGYNESVPMTDQSLPGTQIAARWRSGFPTLATSGASWVGTGAAWGSYRGMLAVAALKAGRVVFLRFDSAGRFLGMRTPPELTRYGRLRSVTRLGNGDLLVTTANGSGDRVLRVHP